MQCGHLAVNIPMSSVALCQQDMRSAEIRVREAMTYHTPGARLDALMRIHGSTPVSQRDALFAVLAARLTLVPSTDGAAA